MGELEDAPKSSGKDNGLSNTKIRIKMVEVGLKQWQLARIMGISESMLSRKLREELPEDEQDRICDLIEQGGGADNVNK